MNGLLRFQPRPTTFRTTIDPAACPGFVGTFRFDAALTNGRGSPPLSNLFVQITTLTNGHMLQDSAGGLRSAGAILPIRLENGFSDGILSPAEVVHVPFVVCLKDTDQFRFLVNVLGTNADLAVRRGVSGGLSFGGGIRNEGTLTIVNSTFSNNHAYGTGPGNRRGAGIWNEGILKTVNSTVSQNEFLQALNHKGAGIGNAGVVTITNRHLERIQQLSDSEEQYPCRLRWQREFRFTWPQPGQQWKLSSHRDR